MPDETGDGGPGSRVRKKSVADALHDKYRGACRRRARRDR
jgi:hypothetical protein